MDITEGTEKNSNKTSTASNATVRKWKTWRTRGVLFGNFNIFKNGCQNKIVGAMEATIRELSQKAADKCSIALGNEV